MREVYLLHTILLLWAAYPHYLLPVNPCSLLRMLLHPGYLHQTGSNLIASGKCLLNRLDWEQHLFAEGGYVETGGGEIQTNLN